MKKPFTIFAFLLVTLFAVSIVSCSGKKTEQSEGTDHHHAAGDSIQQNQVMPGDSTQAAFVCPMHPEVTGKETDKCSKCGMKLEAQSAGHH